MNGEHGFSDDDRTYVDVCGLHVAPSLKQFVDDEVIPGTNIRPQRFWEGFASLVRRHTKRNQQLLEERVRLQRAINEWHRRPSRRALDLNEYEAFLRGIGYLVDEDRDVAVSTTNIDAEIASIPGPQLVVPLSNARYALNAANARWGSLYDALYGTDALGTSPPTGPYDDARGRQVIDWARTFLDETVSLAEASHHDVREYVLRDGALAADLGSGDWTTLEDPSHLAGFAGDPTAPSVVLLRTHGVHLELRIDRDDPIGASDAAGVADVVLESAISTIMDCEDSVAAVDVADKLTVYRNWLGLMRGDLESRVSKGGKSFIRTLRQDRRYMSPAGDPMMLPGRSLMLVRNVGHHLYTDAVLDGEGNPVAEAFLDALVTVACANVDISGATTHRNSRAGSIYVVKPKMHGPEEVRFAADVLADVERILQLEPNTVKMGVMDEERRTSANLKACIHAARSRLAFINTGFLDRTGDEIHTSMEAGAVDRKGDMKGQLWMKSYEARNVAIGLECGLRGRAQIGKGMWAAPDRMQDMLSEKAAHPRSGASCAWVPSPTAATLHATHYHRVDVMARQAALSGRRAYSLTDLLAPPTAGNPSWSHEDRISELENNCQGILGYVVRWVDHGVGCSKVPDVHGVALMEDRATCRISSQHIANWIRHGVVAHSEFTDAMRRMAAVVDAQNGEDAAYQPMAPHYDGLAFQAALQIVESALERPSGYVEPVLHAYRRAAKEHAAASR